MAFQISWSIEGEQSLSRVLRGLETDLKDFRQPFQRSADMLTTFFSGPVFDSQGAALGQPWKRLSPVTVAQKARHGYPETPLIRTGRMRQGFRSVVSTDQAVVYNTADYFKFHQSNQVRSKLPRRVMMALTNRSKSEIVRTFQEYIQQSL